MESLWQQRVDRAVARPIHGSIFAGFNTNVDAVVHCNPDNIAKLLADPDITLDQVKQLDVSQIHSVNNKNEFVAVLKDCLGKGKSFYIVLENVALLSWLEQVFADHKEFMGGQAGIIANQMAALGAQSSVYTSLLSHKQAQLFFPEVMFPVCDGELRLVPVHNAYREHDPIKINWIFEYAKDLVFDFNGEKVVTPRANRVILATRPQGVEMSFPTGMRDFLPQLGSQINVAFMAGYHYAPSEQSALVQYLAEVEESIRLLKMGNPELRLHYEYVPMKDEDAERQVLTTIGKHFQSFGINENEIRKVLREFGYAEQAAQIEINERAYSLYQGALALMEQLSFDRIQVHNLGYYVLVLRKPYPIDCELVRESCLYGSAVNAIKAKYGGYVYQSQVPEAAGYGLSEIGFKQLKMFYTEAKALGLPIPDNFCEEGIWERADHYVLVVPAHVVPNPVSTVGMGDTISSSCYASENSIAYVQK